MKVPTVRVSFEGVGRGKKSWEADIPIFEPGVPDGSGLEDSVRRAGALMSQDIECSHADDGRSGTVHAGFHSVGKWRVLDEAGA